MTSSKRKLNPSESDRGKEFYNTIFKNFLNIINIKHYSRNTSLGVVFAERFIGTTRDLTERPDFEKGDGNWTDVLPTKAKQGKNTTHSSTKLTPVQASLKRMKGSLRQTKEIKSNVPS